MKRIYSILVENRPSVLSRVSGLFARRNFNIDSLVVGETDDPAFSRITITLRADEYARDQLVNQLYKLQNVKKVKILESGSSVERELMIIKVSNSPEKRAEIMAASEIFRAKIIDYTTDTICVEVTGEPTKINAFIDIMKPLGIEEICRTGVVALERGAKII